MITQTQLEDAHRRAKELIGKTGLVVRTEELDNVRVLDFGLGEFEQIGLQIFRLVNSPTLTVKLLVLLEDQICPQHRHTPFADSPGKEETFRCEWGELYVMLPGEPTANPKAHVPGHRAEHFTSWNETVLRPGEQLTSPPDTPHWFQAGPEGVVLWTFETKSTDEADAFADPGANEKIARIAETPE